MTATTDPDHDGLLETYLAEHGGRCPACGYDLRGLRADRCPECGVGLRLTVQASTGTRHLTWWLAVFGSMLATTLWLVMLWALLPALSALVQRPTMVALVRSGRASASELPRWRSLVLCLAGTMVCCALLGWLLAGRSRFGAIGPRRHLLVGLAGVLLPFATLGLIAAAVLWLS